jgi:hypothetical protein
MKLLASTILCSAALLAGCHSTIANKENLLSAAGFYSKPAITEAQIKSLKSLPANRFVQKIYRGKPIYIYADPIVCQCVYTGTQAAYSKYRQMVFQKNLANEQEMTATMATMPVNTFDFAPWGGFWGY